MKARKQIFTILLLFANMLLLTHSVLPHIHHDGIICMASEKFGQVFSEYSHYECSDSDCCWKHAVEHDENTHHGEVEDCDLPSLLQREQRTSETNMVSTIASHSLLHIILPEHIGCFCFSSHLLETELEQQPYYIDTYTSPFVGTIRSLRAPPVYFLG